jgi:hypothetical protein
MKSGGETKMKNSVKQFIVILMGLVITSIAAQGTPVDQSTEDAAKPAITIPDETERIPDPAVPAVGIPEEMEGIPEPAEPSLDTVSITIHQKSQDTGNVVMFSAVTIEQDDIRHGDLVVFGGTADVAGTLTGDLVVFGGMITVSGHVNGDVVAIGGGINLLSGARIDGEVVAVGGRVHKDTDVIIGGDSVSVGIRGVNIGPDSFAPRLGILSHGFRLSLLLTWLVLSFIITLLFTRPLEKTIETAMERPAQSALAGFLFHVGTLLVCLILTVIIVGIPLAILGAALWVITGVFGTTAGFILMGHLILKKIRENYTNALVSLLIGFLILAVARQTPFLVGWCIWQLWGMVGIGAAVLSRFGTNKPWLKRADRAPVPVKRMPADGVPSPDNQPENY